MEDALIMLNSKDMQLAILILNTYLNPTDTLYSYFRAMGISDQQAEIVVLKMITEERVHSEKINLILTDEDIMKRLISSFKKVIADLGAQVQRLQQPITKHNIC
jgi:hypothetical protein